MDDLKLYSETQENMQRLVNITNTFSSDIAMEFGLDKCATVNIIKGKLGMPNLFRSHQGTRLSP